MDLFLRPLWLKDEKLQSPLPAPLSSFPLLLVSCSSHSPFYLLTFLFPPRSCSSHSSSPSAPTRPFFYEKNKQRRAITITAPHQKAAAALAQLRYTSSSPPALLVPSSSGARSPDGDGCGIAILAARPYKIVTCRG